MVTMEETRTRTATRCSFCGKPSEAVPKLIAWPGVYICDECVGRSVAKAGAQIDESLQFFVESLRARRVTWARIGDALGMSRQSAWERFSGEE